MNTNVTKNIRLSFYNKKIKKILISQFFNKTNNLYHINEL